jgi:hypothetical protein
MEIIQGMRMLKQNVIMKNTDKHLYRKLVRLGEYKINTRPDCNDAKICAEDVQDIYIFKNDLIAHRGFNKTHLKHDIGLIKLPEPAKIYQNNIKPICLPSQSETFPKMTVIGFGRTELGSSSNILQKALVTIKNNYECSFALKINGTVKELDITQICAGGTVDSCK